MVRCALLRNAILISPLTRNTKKSEVKNTPAFIQSISQNSLARQQTILDQIDHASILQNQIRRNGKADALSAFIADFCGQDADQIAFAVKQPAA